MEGQLGGSESWRRWQGGCKRTKEIEKKKKWEWEKEKKKEKKKN